MNKEGYRGALKRQARKLFGPALTSLGWRASHGRREANRWLRKNAAGIEGRVLSLGSGDDSDGVGGCYRSYFACCREYLTSEVSPAFGCDLVLDVRAMPQVPTASFDCVFCSGVLEHVDDFQTALSEITRVIKPGGILLLGLPFRQGLHLAPTDFWRFTEFGIKHLLSGNYSILDMAAVDDRVQGFPAAYWVKAAKR